MSPTEILSPAQEFESLEAEATIQELHKGDLRNNAVTITYYLEQKREVMESHKPQWVKDELITIYEKKLSGLFTQREMLQNASGCIQFFDQEGYLKLRSASAPDAKKGVMVRDINGGLYLAGHGIVVDSVSGGEVSKEHMMRAVDGGLVQTVGYISELVNTGEIPPNTELNLISCHAADVPGVQDAQYPKGVTVKLITAEKGRVSATYYTGDTGLDLNPVVLGAAA